MLLQHSREQLGSYIAAKDLQEGAPFSVFYADHFVSGQRLWNIMLCPRTHIQTAAYPHADPQSALCAPLEAAKELDNGVKAVSLGCTVGTLQLRHKAAILLHQDALLLPDLQQKLCMVRSIVTQRCF